MVQAVSIFRNLIMKLLFQNGTEPGCAAIGEIVYPPLRKERAKGGGTSSRWGHPGFYAVLVLSVPVLIVMFPSRWAHPEDEPQCCCELP